MVRGTSSTDGVARFRKARKGHHPYPYESKSVLVETSKTEELEEDRISKLPEEILVIILSLLTIKEAGRSSVLSSRWRYLWTFFTGKLEIGCKELSRKPAKVVNKLTYLRESLEHKHDILHMDELDRVIIYFRYHAVLVSKGRAASDVNKVLKNHRGLFLDELSIHFSYWDKFSHDVDNWVKFASRNDIRSFELDLETHYEVDRDLSGRYKLRNAKSIFSSPDTAHRNFSSLTSLNLRYVNVGGKVLENFLANCNLLKQLRVVRSCTLEKLNVTGPSLKLELLEVSNCANLSILNISATNLVSLTYIGPSQPLVLNNVPLLSQLFIGGNILSSFERKSCKHFRSIQRLESLQVKMDWQACIKQPKFRPQFSQMHSLKQLEFDIQYTFGKDLVFYASLVKSFPLLHRLAMRYKYKENYSYSSDEEREEQSDRQKRFDKADKMTTVLTGYVSYRIERDCPTVLSLVTVADTLEKLVIEVGENYDDESRGRARQLKSKLPSSVKLFVL